MLRSVGASRAMKPTLALEMSKMLLSEISNIDTSKMKDASKAEMAKAELAERLAFFLSATEDLLDTTQAADKGPTNWKKTFKTRAKVLLPHIGLVILSILYTFLGAASFVAIEGPHETVQKQSSLQEIRTYCAKFSQELWLSRSNESLDNETFFLNVEKNLTDFMALLDDAFNKKYVKMSDIRNSTTEKKMWTFTASLFFSATAITAIGYGHMVPQTFEGRLTCLIFCLVGIPLVLVTIADLGRFLSVYVIHVYKLYSKCFIFVNSGCRKFWSKVKLRRSAADCAEDSTSPRLISPRPNLMKKDEDFGKGYVSITFVLVILVAYTAFGAALICLWEPWTFFDAFFYCFTTVTTIGFGDIVPESQRFMPLTLLYIIVGLIITTMCVDLVGSQYIKEIHDFGRNVKQITKALSNFGNISMSDILGYVSFLQKSFGMTPEQIEKMAGLPEDYLLDCLLHGRQPNLNYISPNPFIPVDIYQIKWIEQPRTLSYVSEHVLASTETMDLTSRCSTARTPREWYFHMIQEHRRETNT